MTCFYSKEFSCSAFTDVENQFILDYLPVSSGDAVKVYLYGLFMCKNPKYDCSLEEMAKALNLSVETVIDCFNYWEEFGLVSIISLTPFSVQYQPLNSYGTSRPKKIKAEKYSDFTKGLQALLPSRMISTNEYTEYFTIMETYAIKPEAMLMIVKYCTDRQGANVGYHYISKVAKDFGSRGINTVEKVEKELSSYVLRTSVITNILKAMSLRRQPELEDATLLKKWTQELNFEEENIIFAAKKLKKGNMEKLDAFLLELYSMKSFSKSEIEEFSANKQRVYDLTIKINRALSIYVDVLDNVIDTYTNKWISYGFNEDALLFIANHCFVTGKNTLRDMDELIEYLRARGFIDLSSVNDYFEQLKKVDDFLAKMLTTAGINRRPTPWDRENLNVWKSWNFSEEMILEAAKLSSGKSSPTAYMNAILSNWKNNSVFTLSGISEKSDDNDSQEAYNREYEKRRTLAVSRAQKNIEKAMNVEGFQSIYARLNSIEKDLAFAEIAGNAENVEKFEKEKCDLLANANKILHSIGITLDDLTPRYACVKCNDTGYVGTHRCDCYNK